MQIQVELIGSRISSEEGHEKENYAELQWEGSIPANKICACSFVGEQMDWTEQLCHI